MNRIDTLDALVRKLYEQKDPTRTGWADWLYENHVFVVADYASDLAQKYLANEELARAAALLHDIADSVMNRFDQNHEAKSLEMSRDLLTQSGFSDEEVHLVVDDAIKFHSCHDGKVPRSLEGRILATADGLAHLKTDFYVFATWAMADGSSLAEVKDYVLKKVERDFNSKILFTEEKQKAEQDYQRIKGLYSR